MFLSYEFSFISFSFEFLFQARDSDEREKWVRRLEDTILRHAHRVRGLYYNNGNSISDPSGGTFKRPNYLQTLDKRVSEADAYLQLMIEQTNVIISSNFIYLSTDF